MCGSHLNMWQGGNYLIFATREYEPNALLKYFIPIASTIKYKLSDWLTRVQYEKY